MSDKFGKRAKIVYLWLFGIAFILTVTILLVVSISKRNPDSKTENISKTGNSEIYSNKPSFMKEPNGNLTTNSKNTTGTDNLELPIPDDVKAISRYYGSDGIPYIEDVAVLWQKQQDSYIDFLSKETSEEGLKRTSLIYELVMARGGDFPNTLPSYPDHIRLLARTRRFARLFWYLKQQKENGNIKEVITTIDKVVKYFTEARQKTTEQILRMMEEQSQHFDSNSLKEIKTKTKNLLDGFGVMSLEIPDGVIPMSLDGTKTGVVANTFLLGLTEQPSAIRTLLDIVDFDDEPLITKLIDIDIRNSVSRGINIKDATLAAEYLVREFHTYENRVVMADAIDRIIMSCYLNKTVNDKAFAIAEEYSQWRQKQNFPQRKTVDVISYDSPQTPYHFPGSVLGVNNKEIGSTAKLELPILFVVSDVDFIPNEKVIGPIIDFARQFQLALSNN